MSIQDRIDEGLSPADARLKESLREDQKPPTTAEILAALRSQAASADRCAQLWGSNDDIAKGFREVSMLLAMGASCIEQQEKRYAEGLQAWKANNAWHAARIAELKKELATREAAMRAFALEYGVLEDWETR